MGEPAFYECKACQRCWQRYEYKMGGNPPRECPHCGAGPALQVTDRRREDEYVGQVYSPLADLIAGAVADAVSPVSKGGTPMNLWSRMCNSFAAQAKQDKIVTASVATVYVAYVNSDLTEGRGSNIPIAVCMSPFLAEKAAKGKNTQGGDGAVSVEQAVLIRVTESGKFNLHTQVVKLSIAFLEGHAGPFEVQDATAQDLEEERKAIAARAISKLTPVERDALGIKAP